jgi:hypothetical protein
LADVRVSYPGFGNPVWSAAGEAWPVIEAGDTHDSPELRAVPVLKKRGDVVRRFTESDDRVVTFLIDARSVDELYELERAVRRSIEVAVS